MYCKDICELSVATYTEVVHSVNRTAPITVALKSCAPKAAAFRRFELHTLWAFIKKQVRRC